MPVLHTTMIMRVGRVGFFVLRMFVDPVGQMAVGFPNPHLIGPNRQAHADERNPENCCGRAVAHPGHKPSCERIENAPAKVAQGKVSRVNGGALRYSS